MSRGNARSIICLIQRQFVSSLPTNFSYKGETEMKTNRPSFFQIIRSDGVSSFFAHLSIIFIAIALYLYFSAERYFTIFQWFSIAISILFLVAIFFRYTRITSVFEDGIEVSGVITEVYIEDWKYSYRDNSHIRFTYELEGEKYQSHNGTSEGKAQSLAVGQSVTILVDRNNPKRAFVKELFLGGQ